MPLTSETQRETEDCVRRALSGDDNAKIDLVRHLYGRIHALCQSQLRSQADAEDAVQETFMRGMARLDELKSPEAITGWLRGIAHNVCVDLIRRNRVRYTSSTDVATLPTDDTPANITDHEERDHLMGLIHALPEPLRETILLHYYDEMTYDQMAAWLGVARSTVNDRLSKARGMLKHQLMSQRCGDEL